MKPPVLRFTLLAMLGVFLCLPVAGHASPPPADSTHFCVPFDYEQWRRDHPRPAAKPLAALNVGEPRTVRMIYFLPKDRPFRQEVVDSMKVVIRRVQTFYAEQMQAHGYGAQTFRIETDAQGEPLVHRMDGQHPVSQYLDDPHAIVFAEIREVFDTGANVYVAVIDGGGGPARGGGWKSGGEASSSAPGFVVIAHELGHAFGLPHDFRDGDYIMSYGPRQTNRLSACAAEFLAVHPYFNPDIPLETDKDRRPTVELVSPPAYPAGTTSVPIRLKMADSKGLQQVRLSVQTREGGAAGFFEVKACRGLSGERDRVVDFEYDGTIPSSFVSSLSDPIAHPIRVQVVNSEGDAGWTNFVLSEISPHLVATLEGHTSEVNSLAFSPDGATLASSGSWENEIKLWHVNARKSFATLRGHTDAVSSVSFSSPDGATLASGSWDRTIKLWDGKTGGLIATLEDHTDGVTSVSLSSGGNTLASGARDGTVKLWDVRTREEIGTLEGHTGEVTSVSFSPDGALLASAGGYEDKTVKLWDVRTRDVISTLEGHTGEVTSVSFSPDGALLASAGGWGDRTVILWDVETLKQIGTLKGHASRIKSLSFSAPDGAILATGSWDGTAILWDLLTRKKIAAFGHTKEVLSVSLSPGDATLAGGGRDGAILLWDVSEWTGARAFALEIVYGDGQQGAPGTGLAQPLVVEVRDQYGDPLSDAAVTFTVTAGEGKLSGRFAVEHATTDVNGRAELPLTLGLHPGPNTVGVSIGGRELATFTAQGVGTAVAELEGDYRTWHLPRAATVRLGKGALGESDRAVALSADGRCLAVASALGVWLYEAATSRALALLPTESPVHSVAFSLHGTLAAGLDNGQVELWEVETGERIGTLRHADWGRVTSVAFSRDGTALASGSWDQVIKVWDVETRREVGTWEVARDSDSYWNISVAFSPDGTRLVSGFQDGTVRLWEVATQTELATLEGHTDRVTSVSFSPDGGLLASAGGWSDPTVRLWDAATQAQVAMLRGHRSEVYSVSFSSPDGATLASGAWDRTVRLWDVATRELINTLEEHTGSVYSVTFSRDGATLASGATDGRVLLRDLESRNAAGLAGHESSSSMVFSRDGATLALGSQDGTIKLWDAVTQTQIAVLEGHTDRVAAVSFSPDGALLASAGGWDDPVKLWDVATRTQIGTLGHSRRINAMSFSSPDGARLAKGSSDGTITLWDVATREQIGTLEGHTDGVRSMSFSPDGATLASGGGHEDKTVKLWDVGTRELIGTLEGHEYEVNTVAFSPRGRMLVSGSHRTVKLWDVGTREPIGALEGVGANAVSFSRDGTMLVSGSHRTVRLWDVATRRMITTLEGHARSVNHVALSRDQMNLITGSDDGTILLWDISEWTGPRPSALEIISGDGQQGEPGAALTRPLVVEVRDQYGNLLPDAAVTFTVTAGEGQLSGRFAVEHTTTDADGRAELTLTLGLPGPNIVGVSLGGRELGTFTAQGVGTAVAELEGDYRTWHLPTAATVRLGKGALGESDRAVALSADGRCLAVASGIGVWLYEASTSRALALLPTESAVHSVAFSLGGTLAAGLDNGQVELWEVETGERITTLRHADWGRVTSVAFSRDGTALASGSWDQVIKVWDVETRREVGTWEVPREGNSLWPLSVAFSPDGTRLVSGFQDGTVRLWDIATQTELATLEGHTDRVTSVSFSPDGGLLASAGGWSDPTVRLWDAATQTEVATLRGHTGEVRSVSFSSPDGGTLASGSSDRTVRLWDVAAQELIATLEEHSGPVHSVSFSRDGATLISGAADGRVLLRDVETGNAAGLSGHGSLSSMALSPDGDLLASGYQDGTVRLWDAATRTRIATLEGHTSGVGSASFSSDGALLASGSWDRTVKLWNVGTRELVGTLEGHTSGVNAVAFSPDDATLASAGGWNDATVRLWDVATRTEIATLEGHTNEVRSVAFSHDGATLASGGGYEDNTVKLWNVATREEIGTLEGHEYEVNTVAFSPDGTTLASVSGDGTRLWTVRTREPIANLEGAGGQSVAFSSDGALLVSGSWGTVRLWDVETREQIATLEGHSGSVHSVAFLSDSTALASGSEDGTMLLWDIAPYIAAQTSNPDFDGDGTVGFGDFVQFAARFGLSQGDAGYDARYDLDGNGTIGFGDFVIFANAFGKETSSSGIIHIADIQF